MQKPEITVKVRILEMLAEEGSSNGQDAVGAAGLAKRLQAERGNTGQNFAVGVYKLLKELEGQQFVVGEKLPRAEGGLRYALTDAGREWLKSGGSVSSMKPAPQRRRRRALPPAADDASSPLVRVLELQARVSLAVSRHIGELLKLPQRLTALEKEIQDMKTVLGTVWTDQQGIKKTREELEAALKELGE